jgi:hypothetical protein
MSSYFSVGGDLTGLSPMPIVAQLQGTPVSTLTPVNGQTLVYDGTKWNPNIVTTNIVLDSAAVPEYPTSLTNGVWYGLNTKANSFDTTCVTLGQMR